MTESKGEVWNDKRKGNMRYLLLLVTNVRSSFFLTEKGKEKVTKYGYWVICISEKIKLYRSMVT